MRLNTQGIVIRETTTGENDRIVTLLTREMGVIRAFANGAKNIKSRTLSGTQLLCCSNFSIYSGRDAYIINESQPIEVFFNLRSDIERLSLAQYFCEISGELAPKEDEATDYLRLVLNSLHFLSEGKRPQPFLKAVTELRMLCLSGYMPDLVACENCGKYEDESMIFDFNAGVIHCRECGGAGVVLPLGVVTAMRFICYSGFEKIYSFTLSDSGINLLSEATEKYLLSQLGRSFKTLEFYKSLGRNI